jgi:hypothetical protein
MSHAMPGVRLRLSPGRKLVMEMLEHARRVPSVPVARTIQVGAVVEARRSAVPAPSWTAIFMRAFGLVARQYGELRRALIPWPRAHLYEHPHSIGAMVVERQLDGEAILLAAKIRCPEQMALDVIDGHIDRFKTAPLEDVSCFRQLLRLARLPWLLRRFTFWQSLYLSGRTRARRFGTFMVSSYGSLGAEQIHPLTVLTTLLTFGPIAPGGDVVVKIVYDHRVMDGRTIARCLAELERVLNTEIVAELSSLGRQAA